MSMLKGLTSDDSIAQEKDSVGSGGVLDSGLYPSVVKMAYVTESKGGAAGMVLQFKTDAGRDIRTTLWMSSGKAKGQKNYYEKDGQKHYLPGFNHANGLALLTVGKELSQLETEEKMVNIYSYDTKAEVPTKVQVITELLGTEILIGLIKQVVDKNVESSPGVYTPSGETREQNEIDKMFRASDRMTTTEIRAQAAEATFADTWLEKWDGVVQNRAKGATAGAAPAAGAPKGAAPTGTKKPTTSLFASNPA